MADFFFTDTVNHNAIVETYVADGDTFTFDTLNYNDTVQVSGGGGVEGRLGAGNDYFNGSHLCGNATVDGGNGADVLIGGKGDDHFFGGNGQDSLSGGYGDDWLTGGQGHDRMTGG